MNPPPQIVFINKKIITKPEDKEEEKINDLFLAFEMCVSWPFCFCHLLIVLCCGPLVRDLILNTKTFFLLLS